MGTLETLMQKNRITAKEMTRILGCTQTDLSAYLSGAETLNRERLDILQKYFKWSDAYTQSIREFMLFDTYNYYVGVYKRMKILLDPQV